MVLSRGIFHPKWTTHHRPTVDSGGLARVQVYVVTGHGEWTPEAGMGADTIEMLYEGRARWQSSGRPNNRDFTEDQAKFQITRVQIGFRDNEVPSYLEQLPEIPVNAIVKLIENKADPSIVGTRAYVHGQSKSSNPWNKTLTCQENQKQGE